VMIRRYRISHIAPRDLPPNLCITRIKKFEVILRGMDSVAAQTLVIRSKSTASKS
jgi:hypothetical protein